MKEMSKKRLKEEGFSFDHKFAGLEFWSSARDIIIYNPKDQTIVQRRPKEGKYCAQGL